MRVYLAEYGAKPRSQLPDLLTTVAPAAPALAALRAWVVGVAAAP
jgi:hypothetical protein